MTSEFSSTEYKPVFGEPVGAPIITQLTPAQYVEYSDTNSHHKCVYQPNIPEISQHKLYQKSHNSNTLEDGSATLPPNKELPFVSVCTPTFNRRPFIQTMFECFRNQTYPKSHIEWIIVDDGTDKIRDLIDFSGIPQIKYFEVDPKMTLGAKRNFMHTKTKGDIIVYFDDDDYYPPERISHAVETLESNPTALVAGTSSIHVHFKPLRNSDGCPKVPVNASIDIMDNEQIVEFGPYPSLPGQATAGTFAFKRKLLDTCSYNESESLAEEQAFLKNFTIPFVALDPLKTILVFAHNQNTFDKRTLLQQSPWSSTMQPVSLTVDDFIRTPKEAHLKRFFMDNIDAAVRAYLPGTIDHKPDVIAHLAKLDAERASLLNNAGSQFIVHKDLNGVERIVSPAEIVQLCVTLDAKNQELQKEVTNLHAQLSEKQTKIDGLYNANTKLQHLLHIYNQGYEPINNLVL